MHTRPRVAVAGVTLLELMTVLAVLGVLAALATLAVFHGPTRVRVNNAAFEISALYTAAQIRAASLGVPHYVVFHDDGSEFGAYLLERPDVLSPLDWAAEDVRNPSALGGTLLERLPLSRESGLGFVDLGSPRLQPRPLPAPFSSIPLTPSGSGRLLGGCSFCSAGVGGARGVIRFSPDGTVQVLTDSSAMGGALGFAPSDQDGSSKVVVIAAPAGAIRVF